MLKKLFSSLSIQIFIGILLGVLVGSYFGSYYGSEFGNKVSALGDLGKIVIQLIKAAATPLLFFVVMYSIITSDIGGKLGVKLFFITGFNGLCALAIGVGLSKFLRPGDHFKKFTPQPLKGEVAKYVARGDKIDFLESFKSYFPESLFKPFIENNILSLIIVAILFGLAFRSILKNGNENEKVLVNKLANWILLFQKMFEICLVWLVRLIPIAVFGVVAMTIGSSGFDTIKGLSIYLGVGLLGLFLHIAIIYHGWLLAKGYSIREFWRTVYPTITYGIGVNSSLATLPLTLKSLDELKVSKKCATLGACIGTNLNNDGILLYEGMAVFFVAQAMGIEMSAIDHINIALVCIIGTIGIAGIPEAGFITLAIVLTTLKLPTDILGMLLAVDWILGRGRTVTNVLGDMIVSIALDENHKKKTA